MTAAEIARILGRRGGLARARRLSAIDKRRIASMGAQARLRSLEAERRIAANFRYAEAVQTLGGGRPPLKRVRGFGGRLPGIHGERP